MSEMVAEKVEANLNLTREALIEASLARGESVLSANGAITVETGKRTGRSPKDRYIVKDSITAETVDWGVVNQPTTPEIFATLWQRAKEYLEDKEVFVSHLRVGEDQQYTIPVEVTTEYAWHNLFTKNLFIDYQGDFSKEKRAWKLLNATGLTLKGKDDGVYGDGCVMINFTERKVLLCGMRYAGEMKKSLFSVLNYMLPQEDVLPMHCAANKGKDGDVALFFGLSGTGKTTLSADPERFLIGDDEHGWGKNGVFNFEGGCYAKCINLSKEKEPVIWDAIKRGAIMENVVLDKRTNLPDYDDVSLTQNTRAGYPREHIQGRVIENAAGNPKAVIFLTCDLYGVLPPVARLSKEQAAYYFLSGYTALVGSTEVGQTEAVKPTFSTCFGAPFFPRPAQIYADLLMKRIDETGAKVYLVNTGWTGGAYGQGGERFAIPTTRAVVTAILNDEFATQAGEIIPGFNFEVPTQLSGVDTNLLNPRKTWANAKDYDIHTNQLITKFLENFSQFDVSENIKQAGPNLG